MIASIPSACFNVMSVGASRMIVSLHSDWSMRSAGLEQSTLEQTGRTAYPREGGGWPWELHSLATVRDGWILTGLLAYRSATIGRSRRPPSDLNVRIRPANTPNSGSHLPKRTPVVMGQRRKSSYHTIG